MNNDFIIDFDGFDDLDPSANQPADAGLFPPITLEELLNPANLTPMRTNDLVVLCTKYIQDYARNTKKEDGTGLSQDFVTSREEGPDSDIYKKTARAIDDLALDWQRASGHHIDGDQLRWLRARIQDNFLGLGPLEPLRRDPRVTEILVHAPQPTTVTSLVGGRPATSVNGGTRVEVQGVGLVDAPGVLFADDDDVLEFVGHLMPKSPPDLTRPTQSATLPDGSRVQVAHRVVTDGENTFLAIRRHPDLIWSLSKLVDLGTISEELACDLGWYVKQRFNMVVAGGTGSGKTSLLNALTGFIDPKFHVAIIEDTKEMKTPEFLWTSRFVARPGRGSMDAITIRDHIRNALRSRPDIIMVGEVRGPEALDALKAMNTGHEGSMTTCHANSAADSVLRLETMVSETGEVSESAATHSIASAVDLIVFQSRMQDGSRKVTAVYEVAKPSIDSVERTRMVQLKPLWLYDRENERWEKKGDLSDELLAIRGLVRRPNPITMTDIRLAGQLTGYNPAT